MQTFRAIEFCLLYMLCMYVAGYVFFEYIMWQCLIHHACISYTNQLNQQSLYRMYVLYRISILFCILLAFDLSDLQAAASVMVSTELHV